MPINRYLLKKEKAFFRAQYSFFNKAKKQIQDLLKKQDRQKNFNDDLKKLLESIIYANAILISKRAKPVLEKGTKDPNIAKLNPSFGINWNLRNDPASRYINNLIDLHSRTDIDGSIGRTTYIRTLAFVKQGIDEGLSYTEVAENIEKLDGLVFSKSRAEQIAITELGTAYEQGKLMPMKDLQDKGEIVLKKWQTVEDERVRPAHRQNQEDGYIPLDLPFSGTGTDIAPDPPRCRCSTIYKLV